MRRRKGREGGGKGCFFSGIGTSRRRNIFKGRKGNDVRAGLDAGSWHVREEGGGGKRK